MVNCKLTLIILDYFSTYHVTDSPHVLPYFHSDSIADTSIIDTIEASSLDKQPSRNESFYDLGPLKEIERRDLNYAVKEYLLNADYKLTAMAFYEEVKIP